MAKDELTFRWLGVGGFEWAQGDFTLLLDPFFSRPTVRQVLMQRLAPRVNLIDKYIPQANAILISHAHYDHLMDAPYLAKRTGAMIYGSTNTIEIARIHAVPEAQLHLTAPGEDLQSGAFKMSLMAGKHVTIPGISSGPLGKLKPPLRAHEFRMDRCDSMLIEVDGRRWLVWHSVETTDAPRADILVIGPEGGRDYFQALCSQVEPRLLIPIHWDNFFKPLESPLKRLPLRRRFPNSLGLGQGQIVTWDLAEDIQVPVFSPPLLETFKLNPLMGQRCARGHSIH